MNYFKKIFKNSSIATQIIFPTLLFGILLSFGAINTIDKKISSYILDFEKKSIQNNLNRIKYIINSDFKTFFYVYGLSDSFKKEKNIAIKECIETIKNEFKDFNGYIVITYDGKNIWIKNKIKNKIVLNYIENSKDNFIYKDGFIGGKFYFKPWDCKVVLIKSADKIKNVLLYNRVSIILSILFLILFIMILLSIIVKSNIKNSFKKVFKHFEKIKKGDFGLLELDSSFEMNALSKHINDLSATIRARESKIQEEKRRVKEIMDTQKSIIIVTNGKKVFDVNASFFEFFKEYKSLEDFTKEHSCICDFFMPVDEKHYLNVSKSDNRWIEKLLEQNESIFKVKIVKNSKEYIFRVDAEPFREDKYVVTFTDISKIEKYEKEIEEKNTNIIKQLYTDSLTKLPNRKRLMLDIQKCSFPVVILVNINSFREMNDFYGIEKGDEILKKVSEYIEGIVKYEASSSLYRMYGDEFVVLICKDLQESSIEEYLKNFSKKLNFSEIEIDDNKISINYVLGAAKGKDNVLVKADIALKDAKENRVNYAIYSENKEKLKEYESNILWNKTIKTAIDNNDIVPYFQPILNNQTSQIDKFECLVRLISKGVVVGPDKFLEISKLSSSYNYISRIMIEKSFNYFKHREFDFSINISANDIKNKTTLKLIYTLLERYGIGKRVIFELLETEGIENYQLVTNFIKEVKRFDCRIAIDDFGTGYSNFSRIFSLDVDFVKIDSSLIKNILADKHSRYIVETIVELTKKLDIKTIAEYVSTKEIYEFIKTLGITYSQGYFVSPPLSSVDNILIDTSKKS